MDSREELPRPAEDWTYPYMAAAFDFKGSIVLNVRNDTDYAVDWTITTLIRFQHPDRVAVGFIEDWCIDHDLTPKVRERDQGGWRLELSRRMESQHFCRLISPFLVVKAEQAHLYAERLLPALEDGEGNTRSGFVRLMGLVDQIHEYNVSRGQKKYDQDHFKELWDLS